MTEPSDYETIGYTTVGPAAWVRLARPKVHNAINSTMRRELKDAWARASADTNVRVAVVTGAGDRAFTTGADRSSMDPASEDEDGVGRTAGAGVVPGSPGVESNLETMIAPKSAGCWKPVIAAVNGMACGGAFYILGEADIIIAADTATFFDPHVSFGMVSAYESIHMLQRMPLGELLRMQLSGNLERMSARRAYEIGLASEIVSLGELEAAATKVAANIAQHSPRAIEGTMRAIWAALDTSRTAALQLSPHFLAMASVEDWTAGQDSFRTKRRVQWTLR